MVLSKARVDDSRAYTGASLIEAVSRWRALGGRLIRGHSTPWPPLSCQYHLHCNPFARWDVIGTGLGSALTHRAWGESVTVRNPDPVPPVHLFRRMP
jgi:hypothetical protein